MSRRRYISTVISIDKHIRRLSDSAALLYTWMIPHAEDNATITSDADELASMVVPNRRGWTVDKIVQVLGEMEREELILVQDGVVWFPPVSFYRYQSNIPEDKRRTEQPPANEDFQKKILKVAENSTSLSPSPSPSPTKQMSNKLDEFDSFWKLYPRREGKGQARRAWAGALGKVDADTILRGLERQAKSLAAKERQFIKLPSTWLNGECWTDETEEEAKHGPFKIFSPSEEAEIAAALKVYRAGDFAEAQMMVPDVLWIEVMRRGKR